VEENGRQDTAKGLGLVSRSGGWGKKGLTPRRDCVAPGT
jgi:hypothetical protein